MNGTGEHITLPSGYWVGDVHHREVELRPLNGADEEWLVETDGSMLPAERTTALLARCTNRVAGQQRVTSEALQQLTVGDREALLLHLRRMTLGERIQCTLDCPAAGCGEKMDVELNVSDLVLTPYASPQLAYETTLGEQDTPQYHVRFRLPTGADQTAAARTIISNQEDAVNVLLQRCVEAVVDQDGKTFESWPPDLLDELSARMAELDPQAELILKLNCPACGHIFSTLFDTASFLFQEVTRHTAHLYRHVHLLAYYYHWSEKEIMSMTPTKRGRYLALLTEALTEGGSSE